MSTIPLSPPVFAILLSLAGGERHGYAIMKDVRTPEGGGIAMGPGTLYGTLDRLQRDGLVSESPDSDDERRRYYRLTNEGRAALGGELKRLENAVTAARRRGLMTQEGRS